MPESPRIAVARALRESALTVMALCRIYEVDPDFALATANALDRVFRRHLRRISCGPDDDPCCMLRDLVAELDLMLEGHGV